VSLLWKTDVKMIVFASAWWFCVCAASASAADERVCRREFDENGWRRPAGSFTATAGGTSQQIQRTSVATTVQTIAPASRVGDARLQRPLQRE